MEILFTVLYAGLIGFYNIFKKLAVKKTNESAILVLFTSVSFILSLMWLPFDMKIPIKFILIFALKGLLLSVSWFIVLKVLKTADISIVTITNVLSAVLSFILGIIIFNEHAGLAQIIGSALIILGVALINLTNKNSSGQITFLQLLLLLISALITTSSNVIDKYTTTHLSSFQVQFWFLLFVCLFSWVFFTFECFKQKQFLIKKDDLKNVWIYLVGLFLFVGDFMLFKAYAVPNSKMITISILSKLKVVVSVFLGAMIFKEKNLIKKVLFSLIVILGAILISVF
jgi:drug/metabolite transporter (DMT)-like permease